MRMELLGRLAGPHRRIAILCALLSTFVGVDLLLIQPKGSELQWLGPPLVAIGAALFAFAVWPRTAFVPSVRETLASRLVGILTFHGRLVSLLPVMGVAVLVADLAYNLFVSATPELLTEDVMVLLMAGTLVAYPFVPGRFARERDFVLVFFLSTVAILVVPLLAARAFYQDFERSVDIYSWVALAPPVSAVLSAIGVANVVHPVAGLTAPGLTFAPKNIGLQVTVVITTACSGIYTFGIFASAFVAFVLTEYQKPTWRVWTLLGLGFLAAYVANVMRMVVIVLVGYYTDTATTDLQNMLVAHSYAGWLIFLGWISLFWVVLVKLLPNPTASVDGKTPSRAVRRIGVCAICNTSLSPAIVAERCTCGIVYHRACATDETRCPSCGRLPLAPAVAIPGS